MANKLHSASILSTSPSVFLLHLYRRVCAGVFCDSCCLLPQDSNPNQFLNAAKGNFGGKAVSSKQESDTSATGLRVCDGELEST